MGRRTKWSLVPTGGAGLVAMGSCPQEETRARRLSHHEFWRFTNTCDVIPDVIAPSDAFILNAG